MLGASRWHRCNIGLCEGRPHLLSTSGEAVHHVFEGIHVRSKTKQGDTYGVACSPNHLLEEPVGLALVFIEWIFLPITAEADTAP